MVTDHLARLWTSKNLTRSMSVARTGWHAGYRLAESARYPLEIAMEQHMACGFGGAMDV